MRQRLEPILQMLNKVFSGVWAHLGLLKYLIVAVVLTALALVVSLVIWSRVRPIATYRTAIQDHLKLQIHADEFNMKTVAWAWEWQTLSIGIQGTSAVYKDHSRGIEASVPRLKIMWNPLKSLVGSISLTAKVDNSTWQIGGKESLMDREDSVPVASPILKGVVQPNFLERRWDMHLIGKGLSIAATVGPGEPILFSDVDLDTSLLGKRSYFDGLVNANISKVSQLGTYHGRVKFEWKGAFQYVDKALVGISVDSVNFDFSKSEINGWGLFKQSKDPLYARFGIQMLINEDGEFSTIDVKNGKLRFADLSFVFDGDQKNATGAAFKWILENQQLNKNKLPFQIIHQAKVSGPIQAEGRVAVSKGWDFASQWSLRANGLSFKAVELVEQFDPLSEGTMVFNLAFDGGFESGLFHSSGFQLKLDAKEALLVSKSKAFSKPIGQTAQIQVLFDVADDVLNLKPSFFEWSNFRADVNGKVESLSDYLLRNGIAPFQYEAHTTKLDISKISPMLGFLKQNPVPSGILEFSGALSGALGKKSIAKQFEDRELAWRIDQFSLSNFKAGADSGVWFSKEKDQGYLLDGVVDVDMSLRARGRGSLVQTSSLQASLNFTDAEIVWADQFRKPKGIPGKIKIGLTSVPNKIEFKPSRVTILDNDIDFSGVLNQGSRSRMALDFQKPVDLAKWRGFFRARDDVPLQGSIRPQLYLSLLTLPNQMDGGVDWRRIGFSGLLSFKDLRGVLGPLSVFDYTTGSVRFSDGKIGLQNLKTIVSSRAITLNGSLRPRDQRGDVSFYDLSSAKFWDADLSVFAEELDVATLLRGLNPRMLKDGQRERSSNSLEPRSWLNPEEVRALRDWPVFQKLRLNSRWTARRFKLGSWSFGDLSGALSIQDHRLKYTINKAHWLKGAQVSGAGGLDLKPKGSAGQGLPFSGTWNWKQAPLGELLAMWDLRESKIFRGRFSGALTYAIEKSEIQETNDSTRMNLDGSVSGADFIVTRLVSESALSLLNKAGDGKSCFAHDWRGTFKAWTSGDRALRVDEAKWMATGASESASVNYLSQIQWSAEADGAGGAQIKGAWLPSSTCLGPKVQTCWKSADADLGSFELSGAWDNLSLSWKPGAWDVVANCLATQETTNPSDDTSQKARLKTYLKKNGN